MARHEFALFVPQVFDKGSLITVQDPESMRRMTSVIRLREGEQIQLFNRHESIQARILSVGKKGIQLEVQERAPLRSLEPDVTVFLPTLKKDGFEEALVRLTALGVNTIQLVETEKVQRTWQFEREKDRFERVMTAAAEQSKQFVLPVLRAPLSLEKVLAETLEETSAIFFDPDGEPLFSVMQRLVANKQKTILFVGPEGDLTDAEKFLIKQKGFVFCMLTPTVLRACEAVALGAGVVRSVVR